MTWYLGKPYTCTYSYILQFSYCTPDSWQFALKNDPCLCKTYFHLYSFVYHYIITHVYVSLVQQCTESMMRDLLTQHACKQLYYGHVLCTCRHTCTHVHVCCLHFQNKPIRKRPCTRLNLFPDQHNDLILWPAQLVQRLFAISYVLGLNCRRSTIFVANFICLQGYVKKSCR